MCHLMFCFLQFWPPYVNCIGADFLRCWWSLSFFISSIARSGTMGSEDFDSFCFRYAKHIQKLSMYYIIYHNLNFDCSFYMSARNNADVQLLGLHWTVAGHHPMGHGRAKLCPAAVGQSLLVHLCVSQKQKVGRLELENWWFLQHPKKMSKIQHDSH